MTKEEQKRLEDLEKENKELKEKHKRFLHILGSAVFYDKSRMAFICGHHGEYDNNGLPERLLITPEYGADGFAVYKKEKGYTSPGY